MTLLPELAPPRPEPTVWVVNPAAVAFPLQEERPPAAPVAPAEVAIDDEVEPDVVDVVEVRSPLTVITWASASMLAGVLVLAVVLVLGPLLGTAALLAAVVAIVRRTAATSGAADDV